MLLNPNDPMYQQQVASAQSSGQVGQMQTPDKLQFISGNMYPGSQQDRTQYATPTQMPAGAQAVAIKSDYNAKTNPITGEPMASYASGGIAALRYADGGQAWDPETGAVKLQKLSDPNDPFSETTTVDYTVPKDDIKTFVPSTDLETGASTGAGQYILKDGSTMSVDANGIVQAATPGRNDYTLNKEGYYQPTGENLTWRGDQNTLTKKIGGVEVQVPGIYHKGGYQDAQGNLRVDENGVPVALRPNYLDSGFGESGLADAAPFIMAAALGGAGLAMAPGIAASGFAGMVPASETLMGGLGGLGAGTGLTTADITGSTFGGSQFAIDPAAAYTAAGSGAAEGIGGAAGEAASNLPSLKDAYKAYSYGKKGLGVLNALSGAGGTSRAASNPYASMGANYGGQSAFPGAANIAYNPNVHGYAGLGIANAATPWGGLTPYMPLPRMASGGIADLGGYSDGGRLLRGPGDGMSDHIPATIGGKQPARLADGEFVIPADVVSHLGNGSTDAGAKQLYKMMDNIRKARTGNPKQGKQINPNKFLPKG